MKEFFGALGFLTVAPLPARWRGGASTLGRSVKFFSVVGLAIGFIAAGLDAGLTRYLPSPATTVLAVIALIAVSGGLHLPALGMSLRLGEGA